jgi:hypothetical protein
MRPRISPDPTGFAVIAMLLLGAVSLIASIGYNSSILAFIGLGLVFWGALLLYVRPEENVSKAILKAALSPSLTTLNQMIHELGYDGDATYLPPKYFANPETTKIYIAKREGTGLPTPEQAQKYEDQDAARTTNGLLVTPPGIGLSRLLEKSFGKSFIAIDLENLQQNLPKLLIEDLEIAENLELQTQTPEKGNPTPTVDAKNMIIHARITRSITESASNSTEEKAQATGTTTCVICSAIAIAMTKATGKPVRIADAKSIEDGSITEASFEILEE